MYAQPSKKVPPQTYKKVEKLSFRINNNDVDFNVMTTKSKASQPLSEKTNANYFSMSTKAPKSNNQDPYYDQYLGHDSISKGPHGPIFDARKYKEEGMIRDKEFYLGARQKLMDMYKDIQQNPHKQVSGLKKAKTGFKIPRIKRNKDELSNLQIDVVAQEKDRYVRKNLRAKEVYMPTVINETFPANLKFTDPYLKKNEKLMAKIGMQYNDQDNMKLEQAILNRILIRESKRTRVQTGKKSEPKFDKRGGSNSAKGSKEKGRHGKEALPNSMYEGDRNPIEEVVEVEEIDEVDKSNIDPERQSGISQQNMSELQGADSYNKSDLLEFNQGADLLANDQRFITFEEKHD